MKSYKKCDRICFGFQTGWLKKRNSRPGAEWPYTGSKGVLFFDGGRKADVRLWSVRQREEKGAGFRLCTFLIIRKLTDIPCVAGFLIKSGKIFYSKRKKRLRFASFTAPDTRCKAA